jgi:SAM-dependent methyltransferase
MQPGDFTELAKEYHNRPGYSATVLRLLGAHTGAYRGAGFSIADVGAGTGKLTECLVANDLRCQAVEPNDAMRAEGELATRSLGVKWSKGTGEETGLAASSIDWLLMGSSFHWVQRERGLAEFHRVLRPGGHFTALWNPRDLARSPLHMRIEERIRALVPGLKRRSSGGGAFTETLLTDLVSTGHFEDPFLVEAPHEVSMSPARYMGVWRSVNDIQVQAGPEGFARVMSAIEEEIAGLAEIVVPYKTRAWTVRRAG